MDAAKSKEKIQKLTEKRKSAKIIKFLNADENEIVIAALDGLSQIKDEDSVNQIARMMGHSEPAIRAAAAGALGNLGTEYAKTHLQHKMSTEKDESVKAAIQKGLHAIAENKN